MTEIKRVRDWRERLSTVIEERRRRPFSEENNNCALFMADCLYAMTGVDLAAKYRGKFTTLYEGIALLRADGYGDLCAFLAAHLEEIHPAFARAGDLIALAVVDTGWAGGIVNGDRLTVMRLEGLATAPRDLAGRAFRVP